jgi:hypothetical protein
MIPAIPPIPIGALASPFGVSHPPRGLGAVLPQDVFYLVRVLPTVAEGRGLRGFFEAERDLDLLYEHARGVGSDSPQASAEGSFEQGGRICFIGDDFGPSVSEDLVSALKKDPENLALLQVYADWLLASEDRLDRLRGELIILECVEDSGTTMWDKPEVDQIGEEIDRCINEELRQMGLSRCCMKQKGGFFSISLDRWDEEVLRLWEWKRAALINCIHIGRSGLDRSKSFLSHPEIQCLTELSLGGRRSRTVETAMKYARALVDCPYLSHLRRLKLPYMHLYNEGTRALSLSPHFQNLTSLDLTGNLISDEGARALAESPYLLNLKRLNLSANRITYVYRQELRFSPRFRNVELIF